MLEVQRRPQRRRMRLTSYRAAPRRTRSCPPSTVAPVDHRSVRRPAGAHYEKGGTTTTAARGSAYAVVEAPSGADSAGSLAKNAPATMLHIMELFYTAQRLLPPRSRIIPMDLQIRHTDPAPIGQPWRPREPGRHDRALGAAVHRLPGLRLVHRARCAHR